MKRNLGPILIPSWKFFDRVGTFLQLEYAWTPHVLVPPAESEWRRLDQHPESWSFNRALRNLFWNPEGNEAMFMVTLMERLVTEESPVTLQELQRRLLFKLRPPKPHYHFVFRIKDGEDIVYLSEPVISGIADA